MDGFHALFDCIGDLARRRFQLAERHFAAVGFNHTEARLLTLLHHQGGEAAQDALSSQLHVDRTNAGRALQRLERDGYLTRAASETDKRARQVRITAKGRKAVNQLHKLRDRIVAGFFGTLPEPEAAAIAARLRETAGVQSQPLLSR
jgi:DNA-binding MarR family transcriptional regulator